MSTMKMIIAVRPRSVDTTFPAPFAALVIVVVERMDVDAGVDEVMVDVIVDGRVDPLIVMVDVVGGGRTNGAFDWLTSQIFP
jgi:hypothetical protein